MLILIGIFFGFPIKEYSDYFDLNILKKFFEGKDYNLNEYIVAHFIVNLLVENLPIILFVSINNNMLEKWNKIIIDPFIVNVLCIVFSYLSIILFFRNDKKFI